MPHSPMRVVLVCLLLLFFNAQVNAQVHFDSVQRTHENATVIIPEEAIPLLDGQSLKSGDEIAVFSPGGICVGAAVWEGRNTAMAVWGDDVLTEEPDGLREGDELRFRIWQKSTEKEFDAGEVSFKGPDGDDPDVYGKYVPNSILVVESMEASASHDSEREDGAPSAEPEAPGLVQPANNGTGFSQQVELRWSAVDDASYEVEVSQEKDFSQKVTRDTTTEPGYFLRGLSLSTTYFWRVRVVAGEVKSNWSEVGTFMTGPIRLAAPVLKSPADGTVENSDAVTLQWNSVDNAATYRVQLAEDPGFQRIITDEPRTKGTAWQIPGLEPGTVFHWRVRAENEVVAGDWSKRGNFSVAGSDTERPVVLYPVDGETAVPTQTFGVWRNVPGATAYDVQIARNVSFEEPIIEAEGLGVNHIIFPRFDSGSTYFWRVRTVKAGETSSWSTLRFVTSGSSPSDSGTRSSLATAKQSSAPYESASPSEQEESDLFNINVAADPHFDRLLFAQRGIDRVSASDFEPEAVTDARYYRLGFESTEGTTRWSDAVRLHSDRPSAIAEAINSSVEDKIEALSYDGHKSVIYPEEGEVAVPLSPLLVWRGEDNATYHVQIARTSDFGETVFDEELTSPMGIRPELESFTDYYWRFRVSDSGGGEWSEITHFRTELAPPDLDDASVTGTVDSLRLEWRSIDDAEEYRIRIASDSLFTTPVAADSTVTPNYFLMSANSEYSVLYWQVQSVNSEAESQWSGRGRFSVAEVVTGENPDEPLALALNRNYPNPFFSETRIEFVIDVSSHVQLSVFDLLGREVRRLRDDEFEPGRYIVDLDGSHLAAGVYIYRLTAGERVLSRRMIKAR